MDNERSLFPGCIEAVQVDLARTQDDVHRFLRLIGCYEVLIKLVATICHSVITDWDTDPPRWYLKTFREGFISKETPEGVILKSPALGDWLTLISSTSKYIRNNEQYPKFVRDLMTTVMEHKFDRQHPVTHLCRAVARTRQSASDAESLTKTTLFQLFETFTQLRNLCFHGAVTERLSRKFVPLLTSSLNEVGQILRLSSTTQFRVPLAFDSRDSKKALVLNAERPRADPAPTIIGDRADLEWGALYVGPANEESLEFFVRLSPLIVFERAFDDYRILNRFVDGEFEYLSYKSGDLDYESSGSTKWEDAFHLPRTVDISAQDKPISPVTAEVESDQSMQQKRPEISIVEPLLPVGPDREKFLQELTKVDYENRRLVRQYSDAFVEKLSNSDETNLASFFTEVLKAVPNSDFQKRRFLGELQYKLGLVDQSIATFEELLSCGNDSREIHHLIGRSLLKLGATMKLQGTRESMDNGRDKLRVAITHFEKALLPTTNDSEQRFQNVLVHSMLVDCFCKLGEFPRALKHCDSGLELEPLNQRLNSQRLYLYERTGK